MRKYRTWHEVLVEQLADLDEALDYLQFALEEYQKYGETPFLLRTLKTVVESQGGIAEVAKKIGIAPQTLSKVLNSDEPPRIDTLATILSAFGWRLSIEPLKQEEPKFASQSGERGRQNIEREQSTMQLPESPAS